jgi:integrase
VFGNEFGEQQDSIKLAWKGTCRRAGIIGLTFHDLRREAGSRMVEAGVNLLAVRNMLGHRRVTTTDTYLRASEHVAEQEIADAHRRRKNPRITLTRKSKPPVEGNSRSRQAKSEAVSRRVS